jgi:ankyrin repeat protein
VKELLKLKYHLDDVTQNDKLTALCLASKNGNYDIMKLLIEAGANVNIVSKDGISALTLAIRSRKPECVKLLLDNQAKTCYSDQSLIDESPIF